MPKLENYTEPPAKWKVRASSSRRSLTLSLCHRANTCFLFYLLLLQSLHPCVLTTPCSLRPREPVRIAHIERLAFLKFPACATSASCSFFCYTPPSSLLFLWRGKLEWRVNAADAELRVRSYERCDQWCLSSKNTIDQGTVGKD